MSSSAKSSKEILKSTSLIGGSKIFAILISIIQVKIVAIILGPGGIGSVSLFNSVLAVLATITGLGISFGAVRNISMALAKDEEDRIGRVVKVVKRWVIFSGIFGFSLMAIFSDVISRLTFGDESKNLDLSILAVSLVFISISGGQSAILRGYRRIKDIAKINIYGAIFGFIISVPIYYFYGVDGIVPVLILINLSSFLVSFFYSSRIKTRDIKMSLYDSFIEGKSFVKLGFFTVLTGFFMAISLYYIRVLITDRYGVDGVGYFAAASALSIQYLDILLQSLGTDYFPRLSAVQNDNLKLNSLVNEQTLITVLIGTPLVLVMLTFSNQIITVLYSAQFTGASSLLTWMSIGVFFRLILWPIGFAFLAKAKGIIFIFTQAVWNVIFVGITFFCTVYFGLEAIGIAFVSAYLITYVINVLIIKVDSNFVYNKGLLNIILMMLLLVITNFTIGKMINSNWGYTFTVLLLIIGGIISIKKLNEISSFKQLFKKLFKKN